MMIQREREKKRRRKETPEYKVNVKQRRQKENDKYRKGKYTDERCKEERKECRENVYRQK